MSNFRVIDEAGEVFSGMVRVVLYFVSKDDGFQAVSIGLFCVESRRPLRFDYGYETRHRRVLWTNSSISYNQDRLLRVFGALGIKVTDQETPHCDSSTSFFTWWCWFFALKRRWTKKRKRIEHPVQV